MRCEHTRTERKNLKCGTCNWKEVKMCRSCITRATFELVVVALFCHFRSCRADYMLAKSVKNGKMMTFVKNIEECNERCGRVERLTNAWRNSALCTYDWHERRCTSAEIEIFSLWNAVPLFEPFFGITITKRVHLWPTENCLRCVQMSEFTYARHFWRAFTSQKLHKLNEIIITKYHPF